MASTRWQLTFSGKFTVALVTIHDADCACSFGIVILETSTNICVPDGGGKQSRLLSPCSY